MKASLIIPVCNGGDEPRLTVTSARASFGDFPHEIIVVDDNCLDGSTHGMPMDVLVVRTHRRAGASGSRRVGAEKATGDVIMFADSHCRFPIGTLAELARRAAKAKGIVQPACKISEDGVTRMGGRYRASARGLQCVLSQKVAPVQTLYGTVYAMTHEIYTKLGGWPVLPRVYGGSEQTMSLLCWFARVPIETQTDMTCIHKARLAQELHHTKHYNLCREDYAVNQWTFHEAFFPKTLETHWKKHLDRNFPGVKLEGEDATYRDLLRVQIKRIAVRDELEFIPEVFGEGSIK